MAQCDALLKVVSAVEGGGVDNTSHAATINPADVPAPATAPASTD